MQDDVITIATFLFEPLAEMAKLKLDAEGIESVVISDTTYMPQVRLMVRADDAEKARQILKQDQSTEA